MDIVAQIIRIANGFLVVDYNTGEQHYIEHFNLQWLIEGVNKPTDEYHERALRTMVLGFPRGTGKIPAIKAVREYCSENKFDKYYGLRDAKDYVEALRDDEYWRGYPLE